jgi:hypothetical protein
MISAIDGPAGVGKTAVAVHAAHQVANPFPDGQLYLDLRGFHPTNLRRRLTRLLRTRCEHFRSTRIRSPASCHDPPRRLVADAIDHLQVLGPRSVGTFEMDAITAQHDSTLGRLKPPLVRVEADGVGELQPGNSDAVLGSRIAAAPYTPSTWNHAPASRAAAAMSRSGWTLPVLVVPAFPTTAIAGRAELMS